MAPSVGADAPRVSTPSPAPARNTTKATAARGGTITIQVARVMTPRPTQGAYLDRRHRISNGCDCRVESIRLAKETMHGGLSRRRHGLPTAECPRRSLTPPARSDKLK